MDKTTFERASKLNADITRLNTLIDRFKQCHTVEFSLNFKDGFSIIEKIPDKDWVDELMAHFTDLRDEKLKEFENL